MNKITKSEAPRLIQGVLLKCVDGHWADADGLAPPAQLLALGTTRAVQCWQEQKPIETIMETPGETLPDVDSRNAQIPQSEWEVGLDGNGNPRPPWQLNYVAYLLNPATADLYTFANSTTGARIAVERLAEKFKWMRTMRGARVVPVVKLDSRPMRTAFGQKLRPEFTVLEWRDLEPSSGPEAQALPKLEEQSAAPTRPATLAARPTTSAIKPQKPGKPVKPVTTPEALDDEIPF
jgi:hypothetical protein